MEARTLKHGFRLNPWRALRASGAEALGLKHGSTLNVRHVRYEATGERSQVAKEIDLGALIPSTEEVMLPFTVCDHGGESGSDVAVDHIGTREGRRWLDANGPKVEVKSPDGGEEREESTLIDYAGGLLITQGSASELRARRYPR